MQTFSRRGPADRWSPEVRGTLPEAVADILKLERTGARLWRGRCELCDLPEAFSLELTSHGLRGRCFACGDDAAIRLFLWRVLGMVARDRRARG